MKKRGQLTIFIILGIVFLAIITLFFIFNKNFILPTNDADINNVFLFQENCMNQIDVQTIFKISMQGGYYDIPKQSILYGIPYYAINGKNIMPTKEKIEEEISKAVNNQLVSCTNNFTQFNNLKIISQEIITKTEINDEEILLEITYPISITKEESTTVLSKPKKVEVPVRFGILYDTATDIVNNNLNKEICITCILDEVQSKNIVVDVIDYNNDTIIFVLTDEQSEIIENNIELTFAIKQ